MREDDKKLCLKALEIMRREIANSDVPDTNVGRWIKPSEKLPKPYKDILFVAAHILHIGYMNASEQFVARDCCMYEDDEAMVAWRYAPALPDWAGE